VLTEKVFGAETDAGRAVIETTALPYSMGSSPAGECPDGVPRAQFTEYPAVLRQPAFKKAALLKVGFVYVWAPIVEDGHAHIPHPYKVTIV
jgi:hypothetical protein